MSQSDVSQPSDISHPIRGKDGFIDRGPRNVLLGKQNPDILVPDHGTLPNLKFSFSMAHNRLQDGGWARQVTQRELPAGIRHSIQGLEEGCEFLLIFCTKPNYCYSNIRPPRCAYEIEGNDAKVAVIPDGLAVIVR